MPRNLHTLLDQFIEQFADAVLVRAQQKAGLGRGRLSQINVRMCPAPNCGKPGAGPRNRWFCREHARSLPITEQKRLLTVAREKAAELRRSERNAGRRGGRRLDMSCRVDGCKNMSRGPRFGYICDKHRKELSAREQQAARDKWNEAHTKAA